MNDTIKNIYNDFYNKSDKDRIIKFSEYNNKIYISFATGKYLPLFDHPQYKKIDEIYEKYAMFSNNIW